MSETAIRIVLNGVPPSLNRFAGRLNSHEYRAEKKLWDDAVCWQCKSIRDRPQKLAKARVEILYYFPTANRHDPDNYAGKFILDGLTKAGIIADDDFRHITLHLAGAVDRQSPRTVVTVTEVTAI